jgi:hypothetical protein
MLDACYMYVCKDLGIHLCALTHSKTGPLHCVYLHNMLTSSLTLVYSHLTDLTTNFCFWCLFQIQHGCQNQSSNLIGWALKLWKWGWHVADFIFLQVLKFPLRIKLASTINNSWLNLELNTKVVTQHVTFIEQKGECSIKYFGRPCDEFTERVWPIKISDGAWVTLFNKGLVSCDVNQSFFNFAVWVKVCKLYDDILYILLSKILYDVTSSSSTSSLGIIRYCTAVDNRKDEKAWYKDI